MKRIFGTRPMTALALALSVSAFGPYASEITSGVRTGEAWTGGVSAGGGSTGWSWIIGQAAAQQIPAPHLPARQDGDPHPALSHPFAKRLISKGYNISHVGELGSGVETIMARRGNSRDPADLQFFYLLPHDPDAPYEEARAVMGIALNARGDAVTLLALNESISGSGISQAAQNSPVTRQQGAASGAVPAPGTSIPAAPTITSSASDTGQSGAPGVPTAMDRMKAAMKMIEKGMADGSIPIPSIQAPSTQPPSAQASSTQASAEPSHRGSAEAGSARKAGQPVQGTSPVQASPVQGTSKADPVSSLAVIDALAEEKMPAPKPSSYPEATQLLKKIESEAAWFGMGEANAPEIFIFDNPTCPYCAKLWEVLRQPVIDGRVQVRIIPVALGTQESAERTAWIMSAEKPYLAYLENHRLFTEGKALNVDLKTIKAGVVPEMKRNVSIMTEFDLPGTPHIVWRDPGGTARQRSGAPASIEDFLNEVGRIGENSQ